jgi:uncharacterized protein (DUF697 family)
MAMRESTEAGGRKLAEYLVERGIAGVGPLSSAGNLAQEYLIDASYASDDERVDALIRWETRKNFTAGFVTGLGGVIALPVTIPSALAASWLIQARMAGAIARIYGHDLEDERVRTMILLALAGDVAKEAMKGLGIPFGNAVTRRAVDQIPGRALVEVNKRIGLRLLAEVAERRVANFARLVPVAGGVVGGTLDAVVCRMVGRTAKRLMRPGADRGGPRALLGRS